jgi:hypothetical protein
MQLYRYFVSQSSEFCRHKRFVLLLRVFIIYRYQLSPETFGYTLVLTHIRLVLLKYA